MSVALMILVLAAVPQNTSCATAREKAKELNRVHSSWIIPHTSECPLCASESTCREGFERKAAVQKQFKDWKDVHVRSCARCSSSRCTAVKTLQKDGESKAREAHQAKHRSCTFDAKRCLSWKVAMGKVKRDVAQFKKTHPATCTICSPRCDLWRSHAKEISTRFDDTLKRHQAACYECKRSSGACEQPTRFKGDWRKQRLSLFKVHNQTCLCRRAALRR